MLLFCFFFFCGFLCAFFFFKQKTAYEMRISDWSSDVCSSDLVADAVAVRIGEAARIDLIDRCALPPGLLRLTDGWQGREFVHRALQIIYPSGGKVMASCPGAADAAGQSP